MASRIRAPRRRWRRSCCTSYDWSESSLILDLFTREQGRIAVAAKGAKRPFSQLRSVLLPFQRLHDHARPATPSGDERPPRSQTLRARRLEPAATRCCTGRGALQRLLRQRAADEARSRGTTRTPALFDAYAATVAALARAPAKRAAQSALRAFEIVLLQGDRPPARPRHRDRDRAGRSARASATGSSPTPASSPRRARPMPRTSGATLATVQAALAGGDIAALQRVAARRAGRAQAVAAGPACTIISAPTACAPAASCSRHKH